MKEKDLQVTCILTLSDMGYSYQLWMSEMELTMPTWEREDVCTFTLPFIRNMAMAAMRRCDFM